MPFRHIHAQLAIVFAKIYYFMSSQPPNPSVLTLFPDSTLEDSVRTWCENAVVAENVGYARHAQVLSIVHSKSNNGKNHEDIMFEVNIDGRTSWVLTDRNAGGRDGTSSHSPSPSDSRADLTASLSSNVAYDRVVVPAYGKHIAINSWINDDPVVVCTIKIHPDTPLSLAELAGLLPLISARAKLYNPMSKQCYWYARAIYESIRKKYPTSEVTMGEAYSKHGKHARVLPVPCHVSKEDLKFIEESWSARILEISKVETISQV
jgi:hypothetical protein